MWLLRMGVVVALDREKIDSGECTKADLCYSLQETIFAMLVRLLLQLDRSACT